MNLSTETVKDVKLAIASDDEIELATMNTPCAELMSGLEAIKSGFPKSFNPGVFPLSTKPHPEYQYSASP
jgi:hypothetical protein